MNSCKLRLLFGNFSLKQTKHTIPALFWLLWKTRTESQVLKGDHEPVSGLPGSWNLDELGNISMVCFWFLRPVLLFACFCVLKQCVLSLLDSAFRSTGIIGVITTSNFLVLDLSLNITFCMCVYIHECIPFCL